MDDWANGDLGQRAPTCSPGLVDYYRYSGDPAAIAHLTVTADACSAHCLTPADHPWPNFLVSVPTKGKPYGKADPAGMIQLDIVGRGRHRAAAGVANDRQTAMARRRQALGRLAGGKSRTATPGQPPWDRYANPEAAPWDEDHQTGGVAFILEFFDELIRPGYTAQGQTPSSQARDAGRAYLRDVLLPRWTVNDAWGRNYWDWADPVQAENVTEFVARYLMDNPDDFPNWRNDVRNILTLFLNRTSVAPGSNGDVYSGAWAYPESSGCCGRSLWYGPMELATVYAQYGSWPRASGAARWAAGRLILATYDVHETGRGRGQHRRRPDRRRRLVQDRPPHGPQTRCWPRWPGCPRCSGRAAKTT